MTTLLTMYDDVDISLIPADAPAVAGYVDGRFANYQNLIERFPRARHLSITVFGNHATAADVEAGDMTIAQIFAWFKGERAAKTWRPVVYSSVSNMNAVVRTMTANGFPRTSYRLWSAHYTFRAHVCGPASCGLMSAQADATQYTDRALGRSLDESECLPGFFGEAPPPPPPTSNWTQTMIQNLPTLRKGDADHMGSGRKVHRLQGLLTALGSPVTIDGDFGSATKDAVKSQQGAFGLTQDGVVGQQTWTALVAGQT